MRWHRPRRHTSGSVLDPSEHAAISGSGAHSGSRLALLSNPPASVPES
jgi:hypothetical protein